MDRVDQFLDRAVMATASRVRIVHGHGMGVLRKAIWELLGKQPARGEVLPGAPAGRRRGRHDRGAERISTTASTSAAWPSGFTLGKTLLDRAVRADDEGGALDPHHLLAVHVLLFEHPVGLGDGFLSIGTAA